VHLTFQEYLAAWHLSNQEFDHALVLVQPHLRRQKWFEVLQLLGGEWARQSDEKLDRYLAWLLAQQGTTIAEQAPVVALCANIVKDTTGVAELKPATRQSYRKAVEATLAAFRPRSGVPDKTQLEILEALGQLGAAVKEHLIDATKSGLYTVRRRAIEMLLPHLSDNDLFGLNHILTDRSREPIKTFLTALLERDAARTVSWLQQQKHLGEKASEAIGALTPLFVAHFSSNVLREFMTAVIQSRYWSVRSKVCALLLPSLHCSELQRKLMLPYWPLVSYGHDLKEPITSAHVTAAAQRFNLSVDEVRQQYEAIAAQLPVELILEWRKGH